MDRLVDIDMPLKHEKADVGFVLPPTTAQRRD
jgi:hypothetical protein